MKRLLAMLMTLALTTCALPVMAEDALEAAAQAVQSASTIDDQLAALSRISAECAADLEASGLAADLIVEPAGAFPEGFVPDVGDAENTDGLPDALREARFIVICDEFGTDGGFVRRTLPCGFIARLPEVDRARSMAEADAVLYIVHDYDKRGDYIGEAYNRVYTLYAAALNGGAVYRIDATATTPPYSGMGVLAGERLSQAELWRRFESAILNVPLVVEYPEGRAVFRVTEGGCCMIGLEGEFTRFEVPAEVEGRNVVGIEKIKSSDLEELILPEGLVWIDGRNAIECQFLKRIRFPSTLRRISGEDVFWYSPWPGHPLDSLSFNEGLEEIGEDALYGTRSIRSITLPSTLRSLGTGFLKNGLGCSWVALPEGLERLPGQFLSTPGYVECVYMPASITDFAMNALNQGSICVYTPEGSPASRWAEERGIAWRPCDSAGDMPKPEIKREGDYEYLILDDEAILLKYYGKEAEVTVPAALGGAPVSVIRNAAFTRLPETNYWDGIRVLRLPDTVKLIEAHCVVDMKYMEALYIPGSVEKCVGAPVEKCPECTVYAPASSPVKEACEGGNIPWADPGSNGN
ncbi:MAG: leucine-rich repeat protein [Clostridia bacterium]|nr:leucine-rich repeat protein [Clostridia bacterium]